MLSCRLLQAPSPPFSVMVFGSGRQVPGAIMTAAAVLLPSMRLDGVLLLTILCPKPPRFGRWWVGRQQTAATCSQALYLPRYSTQELMRERLLYACTNCMSIDTD